MRYVIAFVLSLICFLTLHLFQVDNIFLIGAALLLFVSGVMFPLLYTVFLEKNIDRIEKFLLKNKHDPNFYIIYALANEMDEEVKDTTEKLLKKRHSTSRKAIYKVVEALYFNKLDVAKSHFSEIKSQPYRLYYQAMILLEEVDINGANEIIEQVSPKWMKQALLAERKKKLNNIPQAKNYAEKAKQHTKGLQRYLLHKTYEREFGI
ncbi:hypothetical protein CR194_15700 [Salipaludibacillus keqinensis]|uniref:Uncharacterized protein n=1 Tax=Salipaludibacillus keqinensis TaxID=2045207 RepID=A0A323TBN0_9BACI|nr:hypothetical protein [Salipaludibacillus keqinensis]PYZ92280.1 hypothetical protein CR194_15700 [Salipaludibacillus keqinensis]